MDDPDDGPGAGVGGPLIVGAPPPVRQAVSKAGTARMRQETRRRLESMAQTYMRDRPVAAAFQGSARSPLVNYARAGLNARMMTVERRERRMPPGGAFDTSECKPRLPWKDDRRMSAADIATFSSWVKQGRPPGDLTKLSTVVKPP